MYLKTLRFLANLLFKPIGLEFFPPAKSKRTRTPKKLLRCANCGYNFSAFTHRQIVCSTKACVKWHRSILRDARREARDKAQYATILRGMEVIK